MATRLAAEDSGEQSELAQTDTSATADLSSETTQSFTDEVPSSCSFSASGGLQPRSRDSGSRPRSGKSTPCLEYQGKPSELSERRFSWKRINYLKGKETKSGRYQPATKLQTEITRVSDEHLNALQSFCTSKVKLIHHRATSKEKKSSGHKKLLPRLDAEALDAGALNCAVPDEFMNRICLKNVMATLKQVTTAKQHISSRCPDCNRKRAELAQSAFLKRKKTLLESLLLQEKIDEHLHTKDFLTLVGEARRGLPRLSDDPRVIWERLKEESQKDTLGLEGQMPSRRCGRMELYRAWHSNSAFCSITSHTSYSTQTGDAVY